MSGLASRARRKARGIQGHSSSLAARGCFAANREPHFHGQRPCRDEYYLLLDACRVIPIRGQSRHPQTPED